MKTFIGFFDILGFKEIVKNNEQEKLNQYFNNLMRDTQSALCDGKYVDGSPGVILPDLSRFKVNCLHISDSIVFWTESDSFYDFENLIIVCGNFYRTSLQLSLPFRGCLTYGEIEFRPFTIKTKSVEDEMGVQPACFYNYSLIGKGLVDAYLTAESIDYAGCLLDNKAIDFIDKDNKIVNDLIKNNIISLYKVPFKDRYSYEHVFRPIMGCYNDAHFRNAAFFIKKLFTNASKTKIEEMTPSVLNKMNNTIDFIGHFREGKECEEPEVKKEAK